MRLLLCVLLIMCFVRADAIFELESTQSSQKPKVAQPLLIYGLSKFFSYLHNDNFIDLQSRKEPYSTDTKELAQEDKSTQESNKKIYTKKDTDSNTLIESRLKSPAPLYGTEKPKVLLIMDDLSTLSQVKKIEKLQLNITPSIFPKTKHNPTTPDIAAYLSKKDKAFMVHLPLEAQNFIQSELTPLKVGTHKEALKAQLASIKADFPHLVYLNNHTGSKFTQSYEDMHNLLSVFDELELKFIDSITTSRPVSERIAIEQGRLIMARDVFLDNETNVAYIKNQIRSLIIKARDKGYAIAICHPNVATFKALSQMRDDLQNNVELVNPAELESYLISYKSARYVRTPFTSQ